MFKKLLIWLMALSLCWTTAACGGGTTTQRQPNSSQNITTAPTPLAEGKYPVQQAAYNDANGEYSLMLLNTPPGNPPVYRTTDLQMARLTDEEIDAGTETYLQVKDNQGVMHLTEDFKIEYVHNVTETQTNAQTGQQETVIVRRESSFWTPFAGAVAGQLVGNMLFSPRYYVPPVYQPGVVMSGYGGYGSTYSQAEREYQNRYQEPPAAAKNRQVLRTTGSLRSTTSSPTTKTKKSTTSTKTTGSGFGSSKLGTSGKSKSSPVKRRTSFGSSSGSRSRGFSRGRRR